MVEGTVMNRLRSLTSYGIPQSLLRLRRNRTSYILCSSLLPPAALSRFLVLIAVSLLAACQRSDTPAAVDLAPLQTAMQEHTEMLLLIHFKLDNALKEISAAESRAADGQCSVAGYHAADAYRELRAADDQLLTLGRELQQLFDLDAVEVNR